MAHSLFVTMGEKEVKDEVVVLFVFVFVWMGEERMTQEEDVGERLLILEAVPVFVVHHKRCLTTREEECVFHWGMSVQSSQTNIVRLFPFSPPFILACKLDFVQSLNISFPGPPPPHRA